MPDGITTKDLTKTYQGDKTPALDKLNISVKPGEVYGYLGANGAGKSTTIRLLMNFIQPTGGMASIAGLDMVTDSVKIKKKVGYLSGDVALYSKSTGRELLDYLGALQGGKVGEYRARLEKRFEAETHKRISDLSKGNRQKIGIIQALMHQPDVLILDEPTSGLDPLMQEVFYDSIREARDRGAAILMSSHNLTEAQDLCDRIGIIKHGKLIREQRVADASQLTNPILRVTLRDDSAIARLKRATHLHVLSTTKNTAVVQCTDDISQGLKSLSSFDIVNLVSEQNNLENEFLEFYGDKK